MRKFIDTTYRTPGRRLWSWYFTVFTAWNFANSIYYAITGGIWIFHAIICVIFLVIFFVYYRFCLRIDEAKNAAAEAASNPFHERSGVLEGIIQDGSFIHDGGIIPVVDPEDARSPEIWAMMYALKTGNSVAIYCDKDGVWRDRTSDEPLPDSAQMGPR